MSTDTAARAARGAARNAAFALALMSTGALATMVDISWDPSGRFERTVNVEPGKFAEVCGKLHAGLMVAWSFEASMPLDFNVHYHVGKDVVFPSKLVSVRTAKDTLDAKIEQDYCWMWSNKSVAPTTVMVRLQR